MGWGGQYVNEKERERVRERGGRGEERERERERFVSYAKPLFSPYIY